MKYRSDFVTNSSSSSFVVMQSNDVPDVFTLAEYMLDLRNTDWDCYDTKQVVIPKDVNRNSNVVMRSCNYTTYIKNLGDAFLVDTCNNHPWENLPFDILYNTWPSSVFAFMKRMGWEDSEVYLQDDNDDYFMIEYGGFVPSGASMFFIPRKYLNFVDAYRIFRYNYFAQKNGWDCSNSQKWDTSESSWILKSYSSGLGGATHSYTPKFDMRLFMSKLKIPKHIIHWIS
jgi:hypothetical protein